MLRDCLSVAGEPRQQGGAEGRTRGRRHLDHQRSVYQESEQWGQPRSAPGCGRLPPSRSQPVSTQTLISISQLIYYDIENV